MPTRSRLAPLLGVVMVVSAAGQSVWTGAAFDQDFNNPNNWSGGIVPPNDGTANLTFGGPILGNEVGLPASFNVNQILMLGDDGFFVRGFSGPTTINLGSGGIVGGDFENGRLRIGSDVTINLLGATPIDLGLNATRAFVMSGSFAGTGSLNLLEGSFLLNRTGSGSTYTGGTSIGTPTSGASGNAPPVVTIWNTTPFGTGPVSFQNGAALLSYNNPTLTNAITFNASGSATPNPVILRAADTALTFTGPVTLAGNTFLQGNPMPGNFRLTEGFFPIPGPSARNPIIFNGPIGESGGSRHLSILGNTPIILNPLSGSNTWTGGVTSSGALVFANAAALPASGAILPAAPGYVGIASPAGVSSLLARIANASTTTGSVGLDTMPGDPTTLFTGTFDLSGFTNAPGLRIGTATRAIFGSTATIIPQGPNFQFGAGGGDLFVQAALGGSGSVDLSGGNVSSPLRLYLQGTNTYSGGTDAFSGHLIFDGAAALPATGALRSTGFGYIGYTEATGLTPAGFLGRFNVAGTTGTIGFDSVNPVSPTTVSGPIDLTANGGFGSSVFLGTATSAILGGTITPSAVDGTYRFSAGRGGRLVVNSNLNGVAAVIGQLAPDPYTSGVVALGGTNVLPGGVTLQGTAITLEVGSTTALGTGALTVAPGAGAGLQAGTAGLVISNPVVFTQQFTPQVIPPGRLVLAGANNFTLSGGISGPAGPAGGLLQMSNVNDINVTLTGNNTGFDGSVQINRGTITLDGPNAGGSARYFLNTPQAFLNINQGTSLRGIDVEHGHVGMANGITLVFDTHDPNDDRDFEIRGTLGGIGGGATTAGIIVTGSPGYDNSTLFLKNASNFSGGTQITGGGIVAMGHAGALGSGAVTLNATEGGLVLAPGVTFTNNLTFTNGALAGAGTFSAGNISQYDFGAGRGVAPGFPGIADIVPADLTLASMSRFLDGGYMVWSLQDAGSLLDASRLLVNGSLDIGATTGGFTLYLETYDQAGDEGLVSNFNPAVDQSWTIATASGGITGFAASKFTIDTTYFQNSTGIGSFYLTQTGNDLVLNFTSVPEPSTYALMAAGLGSVLLAARRRWRR